MLQQTACGWVRVAACGLALWFGGLSCVLGCAAETAEGAAHAGAGHGQEACPDGCCPASKESDAPQPQHPTRELNCCVALVTPTALTSKVPTVQKGPQASAEVRDSSLVATAQLTVEGTPLDLPFFDRSETYLRLRILRI